MKKLFKIVLIGFIAAAVVAGIALSSLFAVQIEAIRSVTELVPGLYYLEYRGDYGFPASLDKGGAKSGQEVAASPNMGSYNNGIGQ